MLSADEEASASDDAEEASEAAAEELCALADEEEPFCEADEPDVEDPQAPSASVAIHVNTTASFLFIHAPFKNKLVSEICFSFIW